MSGGASISLEGRKYLGTCWYCQTRRFFGRTEYWLAEVWFRYHSEELCHR